MIDAPVADERLARIVRELVVQFQPERIVLFGSRVRGTERPDSDYDLMVEVDATSEASARSLVTLWGSGTVDVVVTTARELAEDADDVGLVVHDIVREGRVVYEAPGATPDWPPTRVSEPQRPPRSVLLWLGRAESDYRVMMRAGSDDPIPDATCFHAHQFVEKVLKAVLVAAGIRPPRTHLLTNLFIAGPRHLREDQEIARTCVLLDELLEYTRYPGPREPTADEARFALDAATQLRERIDFLVTSVVHDLR
jgi:HEPN domain-containing protein/predicted nucleotidyltransferase